MTDPSLYEKVKFSTNIIPEEEFLKTMMTIADVASEMVVKTLGPYGKTTLLNDGSFTYPTKDGWNVLRTLIFNDPVYNIIYGVLRQTSFDLVGKVGDGTTTAFVAAVIFLHEILDLLKRNPNYRQTELLGVLQQVVEDVISRLEKSPYVKKVNPDGDFEEIYKIAKIASNSNEKLARIIQDIYAKTKNPNIYVTLDPSEKLEYEIQKGYKLDCKPIKHNLYVNTDEGNYIESRQMMAFIFDHNVNFQDHGQIVSAISNFASAKGCSAVIFAPYFDAVMVNVLGTQISLLANKGQIPNILLVQVPLANDSQRTYLSDLVLLTNGQILDYGKVRAFNILFHNALPSNSVDKIEDEILKAADYNFKTPEELISVCAGRTRKLIAGQKYVIIQNYESIVSQQLYQTTLKEAKDAYEKTKEKAERSSNPLQKEYMDAYQRYTRLLGNLGVIKVGGISELEKHYLKDSVDDAVLACRSAYSYGYINGLNLTMLNVIREQSQEYTYTRAPEVFKEISEMLFKVLFKMSVKVIENKYPNSNSTDKISTYKEGDFYKRLNCSDIINTALENNFGFDLINNEFMIDRDCYVVNSVKTDTEILKGMVGILSTVLTSNQFLSINRSFDRTMEEKQQREEARKEKKKDIEEVAENILNKIFPLFRKSYKWMNKQKKEKQK